MSGPPRTAVCSQNADIVEFLCLKRDEFLAAGSKYAQVCDKACKSLCDHPMPINSAREATKLKHVGKWISDMLKPFFDARICAFAPTPQPSLAEPSGTKSKVKRKYCPAKGSGAYAILITLLKANLSGKTFMRKQELLDETDKSGLSNYPMRPNPTWTGGQIKANEYYGGWSGMKTLNEKSLVVRSSNPAKYKLTDQGIIVAQECMKRAGLIPVNRSGPEMAREDELRVSPAQQENDESSSGGQESPSSDDDIQEIGRSDLGQRNNFHFASSRSGIGVDGLYPVPSTRNLVGNASLQSLPKTTGTDRAAAADTIDLSRNKFVHQSVSTRNVQGNATDEIGSIDPDFELPVPPLQAGERFSDIYEVTCILDCREKFRSQNGARNTYLQTFADGLKDQFKVKVETRHVPVGDALWIARHKQQNEEYVLDFVIERKNVHDFWGSIKDNRYKQQKLRLMNCGLKCLLYLVEGDVNTIESTESLKTAMITTELQGGFRLLRAVHETDTLKQYGHLTLAIMSRYNMETGKGGKAGQVCKTYKAFVEHCKDFKKDRIKDVFCRQLTQISQVTEDIALSIQDHYPTLFSMTEAFTRLEGNREAQEMMLKGLALRSTSKTISAAMSRNIYKAIWAP